MSVARHHGSEAGWLTYLSTRSVTGLASASVVGPVVPAAVLAAQAAWIAVPIWRSTSSARATETEKSGWSGASLAIWEWVGPVSPRLRPRRRLGGLLLREVLDDRIDGGQIRQHGDLQQRRAEQHGDLRLAQQQRPGGCDDSPSDRFPRAPTQVGAHLRAVRRARHATLDQPAQATADQAAGAAEEASGQSERITEQARAAEGPADPGACSSTGFRARGGALDPANDSATRPADNQSGARAGRGADVSSERTGHIRGLDRAQPDEADQEGLRELAECSWAFSNSSRLTQSLAPGEYVPVTMLG